MKKLIRDNVLKIEHYQPGLPLEVLKKELDLGREICNLASNENPLGPSPLAIDAVKKSISKKSKNEENRPRRSEGITG